MNKVSNTKVKKIVALFTMVAMMSMAVFAKGQKGPEMNDNGKDNGRPGSEKKFDEHRRGPELKADLIGTVVSVDEKNSVIVVKDADGKDVKVRLSPFAKIVKVPAMNEKMPEPKEATKDGDKAPKNESKDAPKGDMKGGRPDNDGMCCGRGPAPASISDIKAGQWVAVDKFKTQTTTIDAQVVVVLE